MEFELKHVNWQNGVTSALSFQAGYFIR